MAAAVVAEPQELAVSAVVVAAVRLVRLVVTAVAAALAVVRVPARPAVVVPLLLNGNLQGVSQMKHVFFLPALNTEGKAVVSEVFEAPRVHDGVTFHLHELYHVSNVLASRRVPDGLAVAEGWTYDLESGEFAAPVVITDE